jgi:hypothetical protein
MNLLLWLPGGKKEQCTIRWLDVARVEGYKFDENNGKVARRACVFVTLFMTAMNTIAVWMYCRARTMGRGSRCILR